MMRLFEFQYRPISWTWMAPSTSTVKVVIVSLPLSLSPQGMCHVKQIYFADTHHQHSSGQAVKT